MMGKLLPIIAYIACTVFMGRVVLHVISWTRAEKGPSAGPVSKKTSCITIADIILDIIFFRRLFRTNKLLWAASWTFHVSLFLVLLRHTWYFIDPVPDFIIFMEPAGINAGYILPVSLTLIFILRIRRNRDRYISYYNFFLIGILFMISLIGLLMGNFFEPDINDAKDFITGILTFEPYPLPDSALFVVHFILVLILIPFLPFHLITAPVITMEARRREDGLEMVLHEK